MSKYPNKIDTSEEIPKVRDNITQINASIINSLRSAIINIEKTLGINPQGGQASTLSQRLDVSLDDSGNIKPEAISKIGLLSGPITDRDIAESSNIKESKIKLDYPTSLLYSEISGNFGVLKDLLGKVEELNRSLSSHISENAPNRHNASSINVKAIAGATSESSKSSFSEGSLQDVLTEIISTHINLSPAIVSSINNSHSASQIYFDNSNSSEITGSNVQSAIENISNLENISFAKTLLKICSNGILRRGKIFDSRSSSGEFTISGPTGCNFVRDSMPYTDIYMNTPQDQSFLLKKMDILKIEKQGDFNDQFFVIIDFQLSSGKIEYVRVLGNPDFDSDINTKCSIFKNYYKSFNMASFLPCVRPNSLTTNDSNIVLIDPASATVIGEPVYFQEVEDSEILKISVDDIDYEIPLVYSNLNLTFKNSTTALHSINQYCSDNAIPIIARKIRYDSCFSVVISHLIPNFLSDTKTRKIKILSGTSNSLGLNRYIDSEFVGENGGSAFINGEFSSIKTPIILDSSILNVTNLTNRLSISNGKFSQYDINKNCLVYIEDYDNNNGIYSISVIDDNTIRLDSSKAFSFDPNKDPKFIFLNNSINISDLEFEEINGDDGEILADIFLDEYGNLGLKKRLEVSNISFNNDFSFCISDISLGFIQNVNYKLNIESNLYANLLDLDGNAGEKVYIGASGSYKLYDATELFFVKIDVFSNGTNLPSSRLCQITGYSELPMSVVKIGRFPYTTNLGKVIGLKEESGIPVVVDKRRKGVISESEISESFIEKFIEGPRNEIRGNGVIKGCEIVNFSYDSSKLIAEFDIQPGIVYVNGIRYVYYGQQNIKYKTNKNFFILFNQDGCIDIVNEISNPENSNQKISPYKGQEVLHLANLNISNLEIYKTFLNLNNIDYKKSIDSIIVSKDNKNAHFNNIQDALDFCYFSGKIYKNKINKIKILQSTYKINTPLKIKTDLELEGVGNVTIFRESNYIDLKDGWQENFNRENCLLRIGNIYGQNSEFIGRTVINNISFKNNSKGVTCSIFCHLNSYQQENLGVDIKNCTFNGPDSFNEGAEFAGSGSAIDIPIVFKSLVENDTLTPGLAVKYKNIKIYNNYFNNSARSAGGYLTFIFKPGSYIENISFYNNFITTDKYSVDNVEEINATPVLGNPNQTPISIGAGIGGTVNLSNVSSINNHFSSTVGT